MGKAIRKRFCLKTVGKKFQIGNACMWTDMKLSGKKQNLDPMCKILVKDVDLGEPTSFLDHVYLGCIQRECQIIHLLREKSGTRVTIVRNRHQKRSTL